MSEIDFWMQQLVRGRIGRREFLGRAAALGVGTALATTLLGRAAEAETPRKGGTLKLLMRLQRELKVSYLYITHDLATVKAIADEVVVMYQGRVVQSGAKTQVMTPPHHEYTAKLLSSVPEMDPDWLEGLLARRRLETEQSRPEI